MAQCTVGHSVRPKEREIQLLPLLKTIGFTTWQYVVDARIWAMDGRAERFKSSLVYVDGHRSGSNSSSAPCEMLGKSLNSIVSFENER